MRNYSPAIPRGKDDGDKQNYSPPIIALASTTKENASASSILVLGHDTTEIEVSAYGGSIFGVVGKWISGANMGASVAATSVISAAGTANYDFVVQNGVTRRFVVPIATFNQTAGSVQGVNRENGLYQGVAFKTTGGNASVLVAEF
jgi:hypothetical protein